MKQLFLIRKDGMWYAHNSCGYVSRVELAEVYTREQAEARTHDVEGAYMVALEGAINMDSLHNTINRLRIMQYYMYEFEEKHGDRTVQS